MEKIDGRGNIVQPMIDCIKEREGLSFEKVTFIESMKYFFEFLENFGEYLN